MLLELPIALGLIGGTLGWFGAPLLHKTTHLLRALRIFSFIWRGWQQQRIQQQIM